MPAETLMFAGPMVEISRQSSVWRPQVKLLPSTSTVQFPTNSNTRRDHHRHHGRKLSHVKKCQHKTAASTSDTARTHQRRWAEEEERSKAVQLEGAAWVALFFSPSPAAESTSPLVFRRERVPPEALEVARDRKSRYSFSFICSWRETGEASAERQQAYRCLRISPPINFFEKVFAYIPLLLGSLIKGHVNLSSLLCSRYPSTKDHRMEINLHSIILHLGRKLLRITRFPKKWFLILKWIIDEIYISIIDRK